MPRAGRAGLLLAVPASVLAFLLSLLSACDGDDDRPSPEPAARTTTPTIRPSTTTTTAAAPSIRLEADGLTLSTGRTLRVEHDRVEAVSGALTEAFGPPTNDNRNLGCESGSDRLIVWDSLSAVFHNGTFVSWSVNGERPEAALASGIRVNSSMDELRRAYPDVEVYETTLGVEWNSEAADIGGGLDEDTRSKVVFLWAGVHCAIR